METIKTKETIEKDLTLATIEVSIMAIKLNHKAFTKTVFNQIPIENFNGCSYIHNENSKLYLDNPLGELIQVSPDFSKNDLGLLGFEDLNIQKVIAYCLIEKQGKIIKWYLYVDKEGVLRKTKNPPEIVCPYNNEEQNELSEISKKPIIKVDVLSLIEEYKKLYTLREYKKPKRIEEYNTNITIYDPWADMYEVKQEYGLDSSKEIPNNLFDAIVLTVSHNKFKDLDLESLKHKKAIVYDVKNFLPDKMKNNGL